MNEEQHNNETDEIKTPFFDIKKEFEVLGNAYTMQEQALKNLKSEYEIQAGHLKRIKIDLEIRSNTEYRNKTTRQLAQEAFNQSTVTANWAGLGKHPVIEDIFKQLETRYSTEGRRADDVLRKLENQMSVEEFFDQLSKSSEVREIREAMDAFDSSLGDLRTTQDFDRRQANKQDLKQRDKMATMETAINLIDFLQSEMVITLDSFGMFTIGAFVGLGYEAIADAIRIILKKPKVVKDDGKKTSETPESSEG